eukprot:TRINITY_DN6455_c0_g1_i5.p1 TRINITY_DN6455_c0_g1~~TRINITY_DN6455_c0_g1_i5.p1  ORF type:complete len:247 (+),score=45.74 TRINITY_DN6455_c0_g1_i5:649-1389(+)
MCAFAYEILHWEGEAEEASERLGGPHRRRRYDPKSAACCFVLVVWTLGRISVACVARQASQKLPQPLPPNVVSRMQMRTFSNQALTLSSAKNTLSLNTHATPLTFQSSITSATLSPLSSITIETPSQLADFIFSFPRAKSNSTPLNLQSIIPSPLSPYLAPSPSPASLLPLVPSHDVLDPTVSLPVPVIGDLIADDIPGLLAIKRTYQPSVVKRKRTHGFLVRLRSRNGRKVILRRLQKGRHNLAV